MTITFNQFCQKIEETTREMSSSQTLISSVIPIIKTLISNLRIQFSVKFSFLEDNNLYRIATYLDPHCKYTYFKPVIDKKVQDEILRMVNDS